MADTLIASVVGEGKKVAPLTLVVIIAAPLRVAVGDARIAGSDVVMLTLSPPATQ